MNDRFILEFKRELQGFDDFYRNAQRSRSNRKLLGPSLQNRVGQFQDYIGLNSEYLNSKDNDGNTVLHHCLAAQNITAYSIGIAARSLVMHGADIRIANKDGKTPLEMCKNVMDRLEKDVANHQIISHLFRRMQSFDILRTQE